MALGHAVEQLRTVKDDDELALLREACAISGRALGETLRQRSRRARPSARWRGRLEAAMLELGAEGIAFDTIVATGPNSAVPHHRPTDREIERGDLLKIDFGARYGGYHADCTRTVVVGREPADWQREIYDVVRAAQRAGRHALARRGRRAPMSTRRPGGWSPTRATARPSRTASGHGVGLEIHEAPMMGYGATGRLAARTPVTVEPGVYLPGRGGVRIEDTLVVGDGEPELLTTTPKDLLVL